MSGGLDFFTINASESPQDMEEIEALLKASNLDLDMQVATLIAARRDGRIIACGGLDRNVIKDVAVAEDHRGGSVGLSLGSALVKLAADNGHTHLFLCCQPDKVEFFRGWGFYPLAEIPGRITLMENSPIAMKKYCDALSLERKPGNVVGGIVLNANPFTLGHAYLVEKASAECDWLHVFVVREDQVKQSKLSYSDRFSLVTEGLTGMSKLTIHPGSDYIISRATFPGYFLKDKATIESSHAGIDLLVFRDHIAPALGINRRYVGTEPFDKTTSSYNRDMEHWLKDDVSQAAPIMTVVIPRLCVNGKAVSASEVRDLLAKQDFAAILPLVPPTTLSFLELHKGQVSARAAE